jgi:hypothetical protein
VTAGDASLDGREWFDGDGEDWRPFDVVGSVAGGADVARLLVMFVAVWGDDIEVGWCFW